MLFQTAHALQLSPRYTESVQQVLSLAPGAVAQGCMEDEAFAVHVTFTSGDARRG